MFIVLSLKRHILTAAVLLITILSLLLGVPKYVAAVAEKESVELNIIMYHSLLKDPERTGKYVVTPAEFEDDLRYLLKNGYHTVTIKDVIAYTYDGVPLPEKPIVLTFDDGYYNNYVYAVPLLQQYGMKAVISVVGKYSQNFTDTPDLNAYYAHVTWEMIRDMERSGIIEIGNHSYDMHTITKQRRGSSRKNGESKEEYAKVFAEDTMKLQNILVEQSKTVPLTYTYPFGSISDESTEILQELGFLASLSCYEGKNYISDDPECLYKMKRFLRSGSITSEEFFEKNKIF